MLGKTILLLAMAAAAAAATEAGQDQGLAPFHAAQAAFDEAIDSFANVDPDHCYTNTSAAKLDIEELKSKFESYRMALLKVNRTALPVGAKKDLKEGFKAKQKIFAATKRSLRTKKRAAKLGGKRCFWTRNPTPMPTASPTPMPTAKPTPMPTAKPTPTSTVCTGDWSSKFDCQSGVLCYRTRILGTKTYGECEVAMACLANSDCKAYDYMTTTGPGLPSYGNQCNSATQRSSGPYKICELKTANPTNDE